MGDGVVKYSSGRISNKDSCKIKEKNWKYSCRDKPEKSEREFIKYDWGTYDICVVMYIYVCECICVACHSWWIWTQNGISSVSLYGCIVD